MTNNGIQIENSPNILIITDSDQNQITVTQPVVGLVEISAVGPQGQKGDQGDSIFQLVSGSVYSTTSSLEVSGSFTVSGSSTFKNIGPAIFSGSVTSTQGFTGSLFGTSSYALTASYAMNGGSGGGGFYIATGSVSASVGLTTGSFVVTSGSSTLFTVDNAGAISASSAVISGNVTVLGTASINTLVVNQTQLSTGSNQLGDAANDFQTLYGTVRIPTGSLTVTGSTSILGNISLPYGYRMEINGENYYSYGGLDFGGQVQINSRNNNSIFFSSNGVERMRILGGSSGNVNIGPIAPYYDPGYRLNISGSGTSGSLNAGNTLYVSGSNVGIGTSTPAYKLDVNGTIRVSGSGIVLSSPPATTISISKEHIGGGSTSTNLNWVYDNLNVSNSSTGNFFFFNGYYGTVSVRTNTGQAVNAFGIKGLGTTSATNALQVYNSAESSIFIIKDSGNVGIGITTPTSSLHVAGTTIISSSASTSSAALLVYKSGSTVVDVQGSSGQLFSITDSLTGSLFSVNTVAGLPVVEAFSDNTVNIGKFGVYPIKVAATGTLAVITGSLFGSATTASYVNPLTQSVLVSGSISATNNIQSYQLNSSYGSVIGGRFYSDTLIAAGTVTYGSYSTSNVANLDIYANNANVGNGALLRLSSRFGGDSGAYLVSSQTGSVILAVNGTATYNQGLVLNGSTMNVGIGGNNPSNPSARLHIVGSGTTSATTALLVQNANASSSLVVLDNGFVGINTASPTYNLDVSGTARISGNLTVSRLVSYYGVSTAQPINIYPLNYLYFEAAGPENNNINKIDIRHNFVGSLFNGVAIQPTINQTSYSGITRGLYVNPTLTSATDFRAIETTAGSVLFNGGRVNISGSASTSSAALTVYKSGSTVMSIQGSQGELFSITDSLSGSLFSVSNISGLPIVEVFSDDSIVMGNYATPAMVITGSSVSVATASAAPTGTAAEGTFRFAVVGGAYYIYAYLGGAWRSGSLA